jgi:hypothetical protein
MRAVDFRVAPVAGGWIVEGPSGLAPLVARSGGRAEATAEALAKAMTAAGVDARVVVFDQADQPVGSKWFWAQEPARSPAPVAPRVLAFA